MLGLKKHLHTSLDNVVVYLCWNLLSREWPLWKFSYINIHDKQIYAQRTNIWAVLYAVKYIVFLFSNLWVYSLLVCCDSRACLQWLFGFFTASRSSCLAGFGGPPQHVHTSLEGLKCLPFALTITQTTLTTNTQNTRQGPQVQEDSVQDPYDKEPGWFYYFIYV